MKDFGFLEADLKSKELRSFCKAICYLLQGRFSVRRGRHRQQNIGP